MTKFILQTPRLNLREMTWDDLDFVATMLGDPLVMRHYPKCYSREEASVWLEHMIKRYAEDGHALWLVSSGGTGEPIGQIGLLKQQVDGVSEPEIGYLVHHLYWRQGYAAEAAAAVRDFAFGELRKTRVISLIRPVNLPSQRVALRIGLKPEKLTTFKGHESIVFSLSRPGAADGST
jgi:[ribosomal protein S5]-alanine N-acetyltransferase